MTMATQKTIEAQDYRGTMQNRFEAAKTGTSSLSSRAIKWLVGGVALLLVLGGYWYFNRSESDAPAGGRFTAAAVRVAKVEQHDMAVVERTIGTVIASQTVQVTSQVPGVVVSANFTEGQLVKKGDLLFQINPSSYKAALDQAKGQLAKDSASLAGARRDLKRFQSLMAQGAESQQVLDDETATVATDEGVVQADMANVETAQINLGYTQIRSPVDGKTGPIMIQPGNVISVTGTTSNVTPLVTINQIQPIKISFFLPQSDLPRILARQKNSALVATIDQSDSGGKTFSIPVGFVGNAVNSLTGTIELRATSDNADASLVPGQLVNVVVELSKISNALIIPHEALTAGPQGQYVYVVSGGRAQQVPVKVLFDDSKSVAVEGDLKPGQRVVTDGQLEIVAGSPVEIVRASQAQATPGGGRRGRRGGPK
jgi:multidrug efflux system membrane fusion protein